MRAWLSPTAWWKCESTPAAARCSPSQAELVSAIWPSRSSVPTATISTLTARPCVPRRRPSSRYCSPVTSVKAAATQMAPSWRSWCGASGGTRQVGDGEVLHERLHLGRAAGRDRHPAAAEPGAVDAHQELPGADQDHREPRQDVLVAEQEERAEHHHLVGQRVEERPGAGGPLPAGQPPVDPVGAGDQRADRDGPPAGPAAGR